MDFSFRKLSHIGVFILLIVSFLVFIVAPILSFFGFTSSYTGSDSIRVGEVFLLIIQFILVFILFVLIPLLWYRVVNHFDKQKIFDSIKLKVENVDLVLVWGVITAIIAFIVIVSIGIVLNFFGFDVSKSSNITDLKHFFSIPSMMILIVVQPFAEEFFFRGFLLDKLTGVLGSANAIIITSILFGLAHLSYGNIYPALMTGIVGFILAILVVRTKNLYTSIIAHILFNIISFSIYFIG